MVRLRSHLLRWLLIPLFVLLAIGFHVTYQRSLEQVHRAFDRTLLGSALSMAESVVVRHGTLTVDMPYAALEMLDTPEQDRIFYRVTCLEPRFLVTGYDDLPVPEALPGPERPVFLDTVRHGEPLRMVAMLRPLYEPGFPGPVLIQVAETMEARQALSRRLLVGSAAVQLALIGAAAVLIAFGVTQGLLPLKRLRAEIRARAEDDLTPMDAGAVPREVAPLIEAINVHTERQRQLNETHRQFIADASHQLKTPLTVLKTQAALALRQRDPDDVLRIVREIHDSTDATSRVIQQLLALARSEQGAPVATQGVDLVALAREATFDLLPQALAKSIDLGFEDGGAVEVPGQPLLLREIASNLVDNAIRYTPEGGRITVRVARGDDAAARLEVEDDGPGIPEAERGKVFDRFYRVAGTSAEGCGLGLAIVRQIAERHGARIVLATARGGRGLSASVVFPAAASRPAAEGAAA